MLLRAPQLERHHNASFSPSVCSQWKYAGGTAGALLAGRSASVSGAVCPGYSAWKSGEVACWDRIPRQRRGAPPFAKRKEAAVKEVADDIDEDMRVGLNEVATEAVRVMLSEDIQKLAEFKAKVDYLGEYLVGEQEMEAAKFMLVVKGLLEHQVVEEAETLKGSYKSAFEKIGSLLEDSGWQLTLPGQEPGDMEMIDDELIPPVLRPN